MRATLYRAVPKSVNEPASKISLVMLYGGTLDLHRILQTGLDPFLVA
jgi:hypothetical protein